MSSREIAKRYVTEILGWNSVEVLEEKTVARNDYAMAFWFRAHDGRGGSLEFGLFVEGGDVVADSVQRDEFEKVGDS